MPEEVFLLCCAVLLLFGTPISSHEIYIPSVIDDSALSESTHRLDSNDQRFLILEPATAAPAVVLFAGPRISYTGRSDPSFDGMPWIKNTRLLSRTVKGSHRKTGSRINRKTAPGLPLYSANTRQIVFGLETLREKSDFDRPALRLKDFAAENEELEHIIADKIADLWVAVLHDKADGSFSWKSLPERLQWAMIRPSKELDLIKQEQVDGFWTHQSDLIDLQLQDGADPLKCSQLRLPGYSGLAHSDAAYLCRRTSTLQSVSNFFRSHPDFFLNAAFLFLLVALAASALYFTMD